MCALLLNGVKKCLDHVQNYATLEKNVQFKLESLFHPRLS